MNVHSCALGSRSNFSLTSPNRSPRRFAAHVMCQQVEPSEQSKIHVAVVGGGPGGLAAANSILKVSPHLKVRVFEKAKQLRPVGFTISLQKNGWSALEAIDQVYAEKLAGMCIPDGPIVRLNTEGEEVMRVQLSSRVESKAKFIAWHQLQQGLFSFLPNGTVQLGSSLEGLTTGPDGVILKFAGQPEVQASIVIGCDGNQSTVRQFCLGDDTPNFLNQAIWRGQIDTPVDWPFNDNCSTWLAQKSGAYFNTTRLGEGRLAWLASSAWKPEDLPRLASTKYVDKAASDSDDNGKRNRCLEVLGDDASPLAKDLVASTPPSSITEHGLFYRVAETCTTWGKGPVTLLGDAAHLGTPFLGQGTNMALEDAVELGRAIGKLGATEAALREYEAVRVPRATRVQAGSVEIALAVLTNPQNPGAMKEREWHEANPWCQAHVTEPLVAPSEVVVSQRA